MNSSKTQLTYDGAIIRRPLYRNMSVNTRLIDVGEWNTEKSSWFEIEIHLISSSSFIINLAPFVSIMNIKGLWMTVFSLLLLSLVNINMICYAQEDEATDATNPTSHLLESIMNNDSPGIRKALEDGENIDLTNVNGWTGAMFAVAFNNIRILQELIEFGELV